jgi:hypothetical protein
MGLGGPRIGSRQVRNISSTPPPLGFELRIVHSVAGHYTDCAITTNSAIPAAKAQSKLAEDFEDKTCLPETGRLENTHITDLFCLLGEMSLQSDIDVPISKTRNVLSV